MRRPGALQAGTCVLTNREVVFCAVDTGSVAELLSAFATIAAVVAATFAARAAIRTNNQQSVQLAFLEEGEHRRERESVRSQARRVACWVSLVKSTNEPLVHWTNLSGLPVYNLTFWVATPFGVTATKYSIGPPGMGREGYGPFRRSFVNSEKPRMLKSPGLRCSIRAYCDPLSPSGTSAVSGGFGTTSVFSRSAKTAEQRSRLLGLPPLICRIELEDDRPPRFEAHRLFP